MKVFCICDLAKEKLMLMIKSEGKKHVFPNHSCTIEYSPSLTVAGWEEDKVRGVA